jgi:hypothetical protein
MGVTGTIIAAKATGGVDVDRVLESFDFGPPEAGGDGWFISQARPHVDRATDYFDDLVGALGGPAILVKVLPDDWAYLVASAPGSEPIAIVLTPDALRAEVEGAGRESGVQAVLSAAVTGGGVVSARTTEREPESPA